MQRSVGRATALVVCAAVFSTATGVGVFLARSFAGQELHLFSAGLALSPDGEVSVVAADRRPAFYPDSRVLVASGPAERAAREAAERQQRWLAAGDIPGEGTRFEDMSRAALLDLETLVLPNGAAVAGWTRSWRYVWPRDAAFAAAALARTGHPADALQILTFLQSVQEPDGLFHARYLPSGGGDVPDDRGVQLDGGGWVLWGARQWFDSFPPPGPPVDELRSVEPLIRRATVGLIGLVDPRTGLTPVSSDYWEKKESALTLGTAAPVLAGLKAASALLTALGDDALAHRSRVAASRLTTGIRRTFGARGYPRVIDGDKRDAAVAFLMPPFTARLHPAILRAWLAAAEGMRVPSGGLSPGVGWTKDDAAWTPETALFALAAATNGEEALALEWTSFLDNKRTPLGSLPEKVTAQGRPASVAPLMWTAALVVLTLDELEETAL